MNTKTEKTKFFVTKTEKPISKIATTAKPKIPMPTSLKKQACVQHTFLKDCQKYMKPRQKESRCITNSIRFGDVMIYG